ncbi:MAG: hypothetical protein HQ582_24620 [Planctomycetes bacterium]|nr:hypothetical protein [Planctomycetota bacterium]
MADFANLRKAFFCEGEPAYVPALEYAVDVGIKTRFLGRAPSSVDDEAEFALKAGYDFVPYLLGMKRTLTERSASAGAGEGAMHAGRGKYVADSDETTTRLWAEEGTGLIVDDATFDRYNWPDPDAYPYADIERLGQILPDEAKVVPLVGYVFAAAWMLMGFERFCLDLADGGRLAGKVIAKLGAIHERVVENALDFDCVGAIAMPDDMAYTHSLMVAPSILREHVFPWHKRIGDRVRAKGLPYLFHSDGRYVDVIDDLIACGYNALHPCEPSSMDIVDLKQRYGGRLCLCGNINLDSTLTRGTPDDVREEVRLRIRTVAPGGGFCCGSSNSVTDYVPYDNFLAMREAIRKYGKYPIEA